MKSSTTAKNNCLIGIFQSSTEYQIDLFFWKIYFLKFDNVIRSDPFIACIHPEIRTEKMAIEDTFGYRFVRMSLVLLNCLVLIKLITLLLQFSHVFEPTFVLFILLIGLCY